MAKAPSQLPCHLIGSELMRQGAYFKGHNLSIPRVGPTMDIIRAEGWLEGHSYHEARLAEMEELLPYHDVGYLRAFERADQFQKLSKGDRRKYGLGEIDGQTENPIFKGMFDRHRTSVGGALQAAELLRQPGRVFHLSGGSHHARPNRASGFCYLQDLAIALDKLQKNLKGPVLYIDLDAHFGDGVHDFVDGKSTLSTVSLHGNWLWPYRGEIDEQNQGQSLNIPVPAGVNDAEFGYLLEEIILPRIDQIKPVAILIQCGVDGLKDDPLGGAALSNQAYCQAVQKIAKKTDRLLVTGGGGYNPYSVVRAWSCIWASLTDQEPCLPNAESRAILKNIADISVNRVRVQSHWLKSLWDISEKDLKIRPEITQLKNEIVKKFGLKHPISHLRRPTARPYL